MRLAMTRFVVASLALSVLCFSGMAAAQAKLSGSCR